MSLILMRIMSIPLLTKTIEPTSRGIMNETEYLIGAVIALFILVYLIYSLIRTEKF